MSAGYRDAMVGQDPCRVSRAPCLPKEGGMSLDPLAPCAEEDTALADRGPIGDSFCRVPGSRYPIPDTLFPGSLG